MVELVCKSTRSTTIQTFFLSTNIYVTGSAKRGHLAQKLKNELLTWCYSACLASQNGTYHRAWSPTIAELHGLVLSHLQENFNYCIIRKQRFLKLPVQYARYLPVYAYQLTTRTRCCFFLLNECLSLNRALAYLEWLVVLQTLRGERPKTKDTPEVKKCFCQIQIIFLYSTKNGHSEKLSAAPNAPFSQSLSHIYTYIYGH